MSKFGFFANVLWLADILGAENLSVIGLAHLS